MENTLKKKIKWLRYDYHLSVPSVSFYSRLIANSTIPKTGFSRSRSRGVTFSYSLCPFLQFGNSHWRAGQSCHLGSVEQILRLHFSAGTNLCNFVLTFVCDSDWKREMICGRYDWCCGVYIWSHRLTLWCIVCKCWKLKALHVSLSSSRVYHGSMTNCEEARGSVYSLNE